MKDLPRPPSLQEERHQLQLHPPVSGDNSTLRLRDSKSHPGSVTPTMRVSFFSCTAKARNEFIRNKPPSSPKCSLG